MSKKYKYATKKADKFDKHGGTFWRKLPPWYTPQNTR